MSNLSGLEGKAISRKGGARFSVNWRARLFMSDKVIHPASIASVYKTGFAIRFHQAVPLGTELNVEFAVKFREESHRIRVKAEVGYCLLRSDGNGVDMDITTSKISGEDYHLLCNVMQTLTESNDFN